MAKFFQKDRWSPIRSTHASRRLVLALIAAAGTLMYLPAAKADQTTPAVGDQIIFYYNLLRDQSGATPLPYPNTVLQAILTNTDTDLSSGKVNQVELQLIPQWPRDDDPLYPDQSFDPFQSVTQVAFQLYGFNTGSVSYNKTTDTGCFPGLETVFDCTNTGIAFGAPVAGGGGPQTGNLNFIVDLPPPTAGGGGETGRLNGAPETLRMLFNATNLAPDGLNVYDFIDPQRSNYPSPDSPPDTIAYAYYTCAHIQTIGTSGDSQSVCADTYSDNPLAPQEPGEQVPAPAAVLGLGSAFGFSRRLRERLRRHSLLMAGR